MLSPRGVPMEYHQDMFSKLGESQNDVNEALLEDEEDPFNNSGGDFFDKFLADDVDRSSASGELSEANLMMSANEASFQDMFNATLNKSGGGKDEFMMLDVNFQKRLQQGDSKPNMMQSDFSSGFPGLINERQSKSSDSGGNSNWFNSMGNSTEDNVSGNMLDAAPLNISLGGDAAGASSNSIASMLRRKGSNAQMHGGKFGGAVRKVGLTSSKLRNTKSEGMLARALKARYNSGNSLNKYNVNAAEASAVINAKFPNSMSAVAGTTMPQRLSQTNMLRGNALEATGMEGASGNRNATWGTVNSQKPGASLFASLLSSPGGTVSLAKDGPTVTSSGSTTSLLRHQKLHGGGSRTSMQDLLRLSKKQSKTQSMLRQSSAQSLLKQTSSQSLKGMTKKVDVSSLLPPHHAMLGLSISGHTPSPKISSVSKDSSPDTMMQVNSIDSNSLLHQSCRLYPTTAAVVESALRIDPDSVRKAVPVPMERGQAKNTCGYPVNVAITHGGSLDVIKLLIDAGPDVLVQKDGNEGSGSLGIALTNNVDNRIIEMLIKANPECVKVADRRGNYPLHVAVSHGMSIQLVKTLHSIFPKALQMRNFHSQTPLDIAQRSTRCSEDVMNYLQNTAFSPLEHDVYHLDQHNEADLEDGLDDIMETNF